MRIGEYEGPPDSWIERNPYDEGTNYGEIERCPVCNAPVDDCVCPDDSDAGNDREMRGNRFGMSAHATSDERERGAEAEPYTYEEAEARRREWDE